jgi:hypothetical protein
MKKSTKNLHNKAKGMLCTHPLLLKRVHGNNDYVTMEKDKQNEEAEENLGGAKDILVLTLLMMKNAPTLGGDFDAQNKGKIFVNNSPLFSSF